MKVNRKLRQLWHDIYYKLASQKGVEFAMKCKDAAEIVDLGSAPLSWSARLRLRLHLSLCQACQNYFETTQVLKKAMNDFIDQNKKSVPIDNLNKTLMAQYAANKKDSKK